MKTDEYCATGSCLKAANAPKIMLACCDLTKSYLAVQGADSKRNALIFLKGLLELLGLKGL